ncbi:MAG: ComEC/Rec2 family competence protein [Alphaproteobacteria bacterium]|nr:ComEC/Rec2 family competence protein [Alphaproteobacteria bacterium]
MFSYLRLFIHKTKEMFFAEQSRWFLWSPVLFGIGIGVYFTLPFEVSKWIVIAVFELFLLLFYLFRHQSNRLFITSCLFLILIGYISVYMQVLYFSKSIYPVEEKRVYFKGRIENIDHNYRGKQRIIVDELVDFDEMPIKGKYRLTLMSKYPELRDGDCIETVAEISPPTKPFLVGGYIPSVQTFFEKISGVGYVSAGVLPVECSKSNRFMDYLNNQRIKIEQHIAKILPPNEAAVVAAISVGSRGGITNKLKDDYRDSGLAHFLSISGVHMTMIAGLTFFFVRFLIALIPFFALRVDGKKVSAILALLMSFIYLLISGMEIPAQRAFFMTTIVLLGVLLDRNAISLRVLAVTTLIILILSPQALVGPSFQMSFAAVIALIAFYEKYGASVGRFIRGESYKQNNLLSKLVKVLLVYFCGIILTDLVASITTSVYAVYHFNRLAIYTSIGNSLSGPIIGFVVMPFLLFSLILMPLGLDKIPLEICGWGVQKVNEITSYVAALPDSSVLIPSFPLWGLLFLTFGGLWLCLWQKPWRNWGWIGIFIGCCSLFSVSNPSLIINEEANTIAVQAENGEMVVLPSRGNYVLKKVWLEKTASTPLKAKQKKLLKEIYQGKAEDLSWLNLKCFETYCDYKGRIKIYKNGRLYDIKKNEYFIVYSGGSVWIEKDQLKIRTMDEYLGKRAYIQKEVIE